MILLTKNDIESSIKEIKSLIISASNYFQQGQLRERDVFNEPEFLAEADLEDAFIRILVFTEAIGLAKAHDRLNELFNQAKKDGLLKDAMGIEENYLVWAHILHTYLDGIATAYNINISEGIISKDISSIIRACEYTITDNKLFQNLPSSEKDVHIRVEGTLKAYFPDLKTEPSLTKPIKNFKPDTGLPSIKTLIEFKFISTDKEAKVVADEILADTRGYYSKDWKQFLYVIYETHRIRPEAEWNDLLRECGVDSNTNAIVLSGTPPTTP